MINNPMAYYKEMGFTSLDSIVYSTALIGSIGGLLGIVQGVRFMKLNQIIRVRDEIFHIADIMENNNPMSSLRVILSSASRCHIKSSKLSIPC